MSEIVALIVDDQELVREIFSCALKKIANKVYVAGNLKDGIQLVHSLPSVNIVTLDAIMPGSTIEDVIESVDTIHTRHPHCAVVMMSGEVTTEDYNGMKSNADAFIPKGPIGEPIDFFTPLLKAMLTRAIGNESLTNQIRELIANLAKT